MSFPHAALAEKLDELDRVSGDAPMFRDARARLETVMLVGWQGDICQIDGMIVRTAPGARRLALALHLRGCALWHAAFCEALELVREQ